MAQANLLIFFLGDALLIATYILNCVPSKSVLSTLYELWNGIKPNLGYFHPWRCAAYIHNILMNMGNLVIGGRNYIFIRFLNIPKGLYLLVKKLTEE